MFRTMKIARGSVSSRFASLVVGAGALAAVAGCSSTRGRANDAYDRGDYRQAVVLYRRVVSEQPNDEGAKAELLRAEHGLFDQTIGKVDASRRSQQHTEAMANVLEALKAKDLIRPSSIDAKRQARLDDTIVFARAVIRKGVLDDTANKGRPLTARKLRAANEPWLSRPELATLGPELDGGIATAGVGVCTRATSVASMGDQPFALEIVASYCKAFNAALPPWRARAFIYSGVNVRGDIAGTPAEERGELEQAIAAGFARTVWFSKTSTARANVDLQGNVGAVFNRQGTELTRPWTESIPYQAVETYYESIEVPYTATEHYYEDVPYTAYEQVSEPCPPPRTGYCSVSRRVTKMRQVDRTRQVTKYRSESVARTRPVTKWRDEPRVFRYHATKHEGRYTSAFAAKLDVRPDGLETLVRDAKDNVEVGYEHDAEFDKAGVHPEHPALTSGRAWRQAQRTRLAEAIARTLDVTWPQAFCRETLNTLEEAARCAHGRPLAMPEIAKRRITELFGDDAALVLALPRPEEGVSP